MTDREIMRALLAGKTVVSGFDIHLRLNDNGELESRYVSPDPTRWSDPDWIRRSNIFGEVPSTMKNGDPVPERIKERGRYKRILAEEEE